MTKRGRKKSSGLWSRGRRKLWYELQDDLKKNVTAPRPTKAEQQASTDDAVARFLERGGQVRKAGKRLGEMRSAAPNPLDTWPVSEFDT